jgi:ribonuclease P protein component
VLPKENRLKAKKDFEKAFKKGKGTKEGPLFLKVSENGLGLSRFGFIVSQKISKKAVLRNKIKRRLRELIGKRIKKLKKGIDYVFVALPSLEKKEFKDTEEILEKLLEKAKLTE